jgi:hypothetical protein
MTKRAFVLVTLALLTTACGSKSSSPNVPTVEPARTYKLDGFQPAGKVEPGKPVKVAFTIQQPNGQPLTAYRRGSGPHTGIHLIIVRGDLNVIIHKHPPVAANGKLEDEIVFPEPGKYRVVVDAYPKTSANPNTPGTQGNFQLFDSIDVAGRYKPQPLPPNRKTVEAGGFRFTLHGKPRLRAIEPAFLTIGVTDAQGRPAKFTPWFGALAHAIFFGQGSLDYFHTHVCAPGASGCTSFLGATQVAGSSTTPGKLRVGVLVPVAGKWRLFLQSRVNGRVVTAPFTLEVA